MACPFCNNSRVVATTYPLNVFNNKEFRYVKCVSCKLIYQERFPDEDDYKTMYPPSYQGNAVETDIQPDPYVKLYGLRFSYGYQFDIIKKETGSSSSILDYGCGTGHFLANAVHYGFACDGAEFNEVYLKILSDHFKKSRFYTIEKLLSGEFDEKYDVIRLSNVLEHLTNPRQILTKLSALLKPDGIFLIEGPIEDNFSFAELSRKIYYRIDKWLKPSRVVSSPPYHIFFSNAVNQRHFFKDCGFREIHFKTAEAAWPFPESIKEAKGIQNKAGAVISKISRFLTPLFDSTGGNIFIYCGKIDRQ